EGRGWIPLLLQVAPGDNPHGAAPANGARLAAFHAEAPRPACRGWEDGTALDSAPSQPETRRRTAGHFSRQSPDDDRGSGFPASPPRVGSRVPARVLERA